MSYNEGYENKDKKARELQFRKLFMQLLPKFLLGTVLGVAVVTIGQTRAFKKPEINLNYLYVEEDVLQYEFNIDAVDSNLDYESLIIRLESNSDIQETEGVVGLQSGTFSIVQNRQYKIMVWGNIGWGDQMLFEKKVTAKRNPYVKMNQLTQERDSLFIQFDLLNSSVISDEKITIQVLIGLKTIYMEDYPAQNQYSITIPDIEIDQVYCVRIIANTPKRTTLFEDFIITSTDPFVSFYSEGFENLIYYDLYIEDFYERINGNIEILLMKNNKVIDKQIIEDYTNETHSLFGEFIGETPFEGEYKLLVKAKVGLSETILASQELYIVPLIQLSYEKSRDKLIVSVDIEKYKIDEYQIKVKLFDLETEETQSNLIDMKLKCEFIYDETHTYDLTFEVIRKGKVLPYYHSYAIRIDSTITKEMMINKAYILYNSTEKRYDLHLDLTNSYNLDDFDYIEYELTEGFDYVIDSGSFVYQDQVQIPLQHPYEEIIVKIYGYKNNNGELLATKAIQDEYPYAILSLHSGNELVYYNITTKGFSPNSDDTYEVILTDSNNQTISSTPELYYHELFGEMYSVRYGNAYVELFRNGIAIGGERIYVNPYLDLQYQTLQNSFIVSYNTGNTHVVEPMRLEIYDHYNNLIKSSYLGEVEVLNPIEGSQYIIQIVIEADEEYIIYNEIYTYNFANTTNSVSITRGEYIANPVAGASLYTLRIYFENTFVDQSTILFFEVNNNFDILGEYEIPMNVSFFELEVYEQHPVINIVVKDLSLNVILEQNNIPLTFVDVPDELVINSANLFYNSDFKQYQVSLYMNSTYPQNTFEIYRFDLLDESYSVIKSYDMNYQDSITLILEDVIPARYVQVYGYRNQQYEYLAQRTLDNDMVVAKLNLASNTLLFTYSVELSGYPADPTSPYELRVVDSTGLIETIPLDYNNLAGEYPVNNYGVAEVELYYDGYPIGGNSVFIYPAISDEYLFGNWSLSWSYNYGTTIVSEPTRIEVWYQNQILKTTYDTKVVIQNPIDYGVYQINVILESNVEHNIYQLELTYVNPHIQDEIYVSSGKYFNPITGSTDYTLRIYFDNTYTDQGMILLFEITTEAGTLNPKEVAVTDAYVDFLVPEIYYNVSVTIKNLNQDIILVSENIPLTLP